MASLTEKQHQFCRHYVANGGKPMPAARLAGYSEPTTDGWKLLRKPHIREEIQRLQVALAKTGNAIIAKAIADSQGIGNDDSHDPVSLSLAAALVARRGADDEARAVVSMAYVMAGMIEGMEMALGRLPVPMTLKRTNVLAELVANLTDKQRAFCRHYVANGGVATSAARAAGYAEPGPEGFRLIRKRHILEEIERLHGVFRWPLGIEAELC